jgi:predicted DNA-binding protein (MmcQ/YjbR family)
MMKRVLLATGIATAVLLEGCDNSNKIYMHHKPTIGEELLDLKRSEKKGSIYKQEFRDIKAAYLRMLERKYLKSQEKE